jgi:hypothetical protein
VESSSPSKRAATVGSDNGDSQFAMVSEWMVNGNINEFIKANRDVNRFELVGFRTSTANRTRH